MPTQKRNQPNPSASHLRVQLLRLAINFLRLDPAGINRKGEAGVGLEITLLSYSGFARIFLDSGLRCQALRCLVWVERSSSIVANPGWVDGRLMSRGRGRLTGLIITLPLVFLKSYG